MAVYKIPQDVEAEDKLLGPFTFRQFIYLLIVAAMIFIGFVLWQISPFLAIIPLPVILVFGALALPLRKEQSMEVYLGALFSYIVKPKIRLWDPDGIETRVEISVPKVVEASLTKDISGEEAGRRFAYLAQIVDSRGWATGGYNPNANINPSNNLNPEVYQEAQNTIDILDENHILGQNINQRLEQTTATYKENIMKNIQQPLNHQEAEPQNPMLAAYPELAAHQAPALTINPYPTSNQFQVTPVGEQPPSNAPPVAQAAATEESQTKEEDSQKAISPDIIELATNAPEDFTIATLASQAKRITKEKHDRLGDEEVVISLR